MISFSSRLKSLRKESNLSQVNLAEDLGYSRSTIANYEQNTRLPSADVLKKIADYFEVSLDYLLGRSNIRLSLKDFLSQRTPSILLFIDPDTGKIVEHSLFALSFYGYSRKELLNKTIYDLNTLPEERIKNLMNKAKNKKHQLFHFKHKLANGKIKDVKITTTTLVINDKIIIGSSVQDITNFNNNNNIYNNFLDSLITTLSKCNLYQTPYKKYHPANVAALSYEIGKHLALPVQKLRSLQIAGLLHDIGELNIPESILNKPCKLSNNELNLIKDHPKFGYEIIDNIEFKQPIAKIVLQHHERIDGSGYPEGLSDNEILIESKIVAVADVIEAMTSDRPYRDAYSLSQALKRIKKESNKKFDREIVNICLKIFNNNLFNFKK